MSVANTNLCRLCRVVVPINRSISLLSHRGVQQRLPTSIANLLDVTIARDDGLRQYICEKCKRQLESLEKVAEDLEAFREQAKGCQRMLSLPAVGLMKHTKESNGAFTSPDTAKARPPAKWPVGPAGTKRTLDFGLCSTDKHECTFTILLL